MDLLYGPVASWRLGKSLGVDLICSSKKICSFNCIYCQLQETEKITAKRQKFVDLTKLKQELETTLKESNPDVITLSGTGEPTLASNMDKAIKIIKKTTDLPIAILTNSTMFPNKKVRETLQKIDIIVAKLDAPNEQVFQKINQPAEKINFKKTFKGIKKIKKSFKGKLSLQMMFMDENKDYVDEMVKRAEEINPDEIQINTPLRPCKLSPLSKKELDIIEKKFKDFNTLNVYHSTKPKVNPLEKIDILRRRGTEK
ncbi:MAG: radical SAM protein [Candidatus Thermoplasmatota archaeon]